MQGNLHAGFGGRPRGKGTWTLPGNLALWPTHLAANLAYAYDRGSERGVADVLAKEQLQQRRGNKLRGGGVVEPPTPIYE